IVAIEPALKPAVARTKSGVVGVLATTQTLASEKFSRLMENVRTVRVRMILQPCPGLAEQVENGQLDDGLTHGLLEKYVPPLVEQRADTIVLGCTHYTFLIPEIRTMAGPDVAVIEPAPAVARELRRRLIEARLLTSANSRGTDQFWTSGSP